MLIDMTVYQIGKFHNVENAYVEMSKMFDKFAQIQPSRNGETKEIHPFFYTIEDFSQYMLTAKGRVINFPFALAEILWIMLGDDKLWVTDYNKQMAEYADDIIANAGPGFNAAYGKRMRGPWVDQFEDTIRFLKMDNDSRHAVIVYRDPQEDRSVKKTKDRACNISSMFLIRNGILNITQTVRSHDFIWGVPYNFMQFGYIAQAIAERLDVSVGHYAELNNSLHVYDKHYGELEGIGYNNELLQCDFTIPKIGDVDYINVKYYEELIKEKISNNVDDYKYFIIQISKGFSYSPFWKDGLLVLLAYWLKDNKQQSLMVLDDVESDLFKLMTLRYFYHYSKSWKKILDNEDSLVSEYIRNIWKWDHKEVLAWLK